MAKQRRSFNRPLPKRDLEKIYIIATEGEKTDYRKKIHIKVLPTRKGSSSPQAVVKRLKEYANEASLKAKDELWVVIDVPEWTEEQLQSVFDTCLKEKYFLAASYPSFEIWLVLHQENPKTPSDVISCECELTRILGKKYEKGDYDPTKLLPYVRDAIRHGKRLHTDQAEKWPRSVGSHVYLLVSKLTETK
jgi:hypothetical protein